MKRSVGVLLALILCALLVGCTGKKEKTPSPSGQSSTSSTSTTGGIVLPDDNWD